LVGQLRRVDRAPRTMAQIFSVLPASLIGVGRKSAAVIGPFQYVAGSAGTLAKCSAIGLLSHPPEELGLKKSRSDPRGRSSSTTREERPGMSGIARSALTAWPARIVQKRGCARWWARRDATRQIEDACRRNSVACRASSIACFEVSVARRGNSFAVLCSQIRVPRIRESRSPHFP
jgi:hypothetical protein